MMTLLRRLGEHSRRLRCLVFHSSYIQRGQMRRYFWWDCRKDGTLRIWKMSR